MCLRAGREDVENHFGAIEHLDAGRLLERRDRLLGFLGKASDVAVVGQATDGADALRLIAETKPELVFLDELTTGLDPQARHLVWERLYKLKQEGVTQVLTTHYMDEAVQCDRIAYIAYGKKLLDAPTASIPAEVGLKAHDGRSQRRH